MNGSSGSGSVAVVDHRPKVPAGTAGGPRHHAAAIASSSAATWTPHRSANRPSPITGQDSLPRRQKQDTLEAERNASEDEDDSGSVQSDGNESSSGTVSDFSVDEIPVWIKGEQRWISGVSDDTTCGDLIEVLMQQEQGAGGPTPDVKDYCITERWRQVEQVLDNGTKIWQIWTAWGKAQPEVKFILRRVDGSHGPVGSGGNGAAGGTHGTVERDRDSGRGSPTGSINSAIVRRKRHRAQKSTFAWMTHGQTIHPKSSKTSIERLMKLILEQGDIIQQQLSKLRDREMQINMIEEERHRLREREHGKNYLLETYLKGLTEATETDPNAIDSGITSEATTTASPEMDFAPDHDSDNNASASGEASSVKEQIKLLEKIVSLNKQIQREEESAVKLFQRVRHYQLEDPPDEAKTQLEEALAKLNSSIDKDNHELQMIDESLRQSDAMLQEKTDLLRSLTEELNHQDVVDAKVIMDFSQPTPVMRLDRGLGEVQDSHQQVAMSHASHPPYQTMTFGPGKPLPSYPLYPIAEIPTKPVPVPVGPGEPAKIVIASNTLPRNFQRPTLVAPSGLPGLTVPSDAISVHQINKFIQCSNNLGTNCNTNIDDKVCPKQLFHSAVSSVECQSTVKALTEDFANMGTLV
ncbi:ras association domain-containing protein 10 [Anopheles stephensi]|uniref:ras association domain-containing protein 10 n=1 Tax=Anopheles stephensi TaxID=30069 RepID=UPI0007D3EF16|nr:ras association domain-containing protein 10 [Anopheles stephensi]XP_035893382.1 ras association domain-containing protein 10 [Anopheles stephensi]XP_035893383.1 ras association domain-containing protein 10 [Anopheles stephensi]